MNKKKAQLRTDSTQVNIVVDVVYSQYISLIKHVLVLVHRKESRKCRRPVCLQ